jgi:heme oxygenase (mycobilin-producing)
MPITRIFRVRIDASMRQEFEEKFSSISVRTVQETPGFISVSILKPSKWAPDEYSMISQWEDEKALIALVGEKWNHAVIPPGMNDFVIECSVYHYESWSFHDSAEALDRLTFPVIPDQSPIDLNF